MKKSMKSERIKVYGVIPARYSSSRFPGKMLAPILGKSVVQRAYESALKSTSLDILILATDDEKIESHAKTFTNTIIMTPKECPNGTERSFHALKSYPEVNDDDIVVVIQGDRPCIMPEAIDALVSVLKNNPQEVCATPLCCTSDPDEIASDAAVKCVTNLSGHALYFSRYPIPWGKTAHSVLKHIGIYAFRYHFLKTYVALSATPLMLDEDLEQLKILEHGYKLKTVLLTGNEINDLSVDYPKDIQRVEQWLQKQNIFS